MPRKPFFRKFDGWWYVQLRQGRKRFLKKLKGKENQQSLPPFQSADGRGDAAPAD